MPKPAKRMPKKNQIITGFLLSKGTKTFDQLASQYSASIPYTRQVIKKHLKKNPGLNLRMKRKKYAYKNPEENRIISIIMKFPGASNERIISMLSEQGVNTTIKSIGQARRNLMKDKRITIGKHTKTWLHGAITRKAVYNEALKNPGKTIYIEDILKNPEIKKLNLSRYSIQNSARKMRREAPLLRIKAKELREKGLTESSKEFENAAAVYGIKIKRKKKEPVNATKEEIRKILEIESAVMNSSGYYARRRTFPIKDFKAFVREKLYTNLIKQLSAISDRAKRAKLAKVIIRDYLSKAFNQRLTMERHSFSYADAQRFIALKKRMNKGMSLKQAVIAIKKLKGAYYKSLDLNKAEKLLEQAEKKRAREFTTANFLYSGTTKRNN